MLPKYIINEGTKDLIILGLDDEERELVFILVILHLSVKTLQVETILGGTEDKFRNSNLAIIWKESPNHC